MGLYLCIFDEDSEEIEGVEVGSYADFNLLRETVTTLVEDGSPGTLCPVLIKHSDCDGQWTPKEASLLLREFDLIQTAFSNAPPMAFNADWKRHVAKKVGIDPQSLLDCFFDIDGEPLIERLRGLAKVSIESDAPILFQ
ncbi:Imm70 family immunity protein [Paraburkholderia fungorum]|uniref:Imm70 family immunity protein n=1 Tax=Paraburkholderia fungorum TaxID=134537 RepID=UPI0038B88E1F